MKKLGFVTVAAVALLLAGCSGGTVAAPESTEAAAPTAAPITQAPSTESASESDYGDYTQDEFFVKSVQAFWKGDMPSDPELVAAGKEACSQLSAGTAEEAVVAVVGDSDDAKSNNNRVIVSATQVYCPEFD